MAKVDLGTKRVCPECEAKFYDLAKNPAICPMCKNSFDPAELDIKPVIHTGPLKPSKSQMEAEAEENAEDTKADEADEDDIDEEEQEAKELELDGDDVAVIGGDDDGKRTDYDGFVADEDEDEDAALVADDDDENTMPPPDDGDDDDDVEEVEI